MSGDTAIFHLYYVLCIQSMDWMENKDVPKKKKQPISMVSLSLKKILINFSADIFWYLCLE